MTILKLHVHVKCSAIIIEFWFKLHPARERLGRGCTVNAYCIKHGDYTVQNQRSYRCLEHNTAHAVMTHAAFIFINMLGRFWIVRTAPVPLDIVREFFIDSLARADHRLVIIFIHIRRRILTKHAGTAAVRTHCIQQGYTFVAIESCMADGIIMSRRQIAVAHHIRANSCNP